MRNFLFRFGKAFNSYRSPLWLGIQRAVGRRYIKITDQRTGLSFRCLSGADLMLGDVFHTQLYDVPMVPVRAGDLVIDVGANHGFANCYFAQRGANVVAFEPSPTVFELLRHNVQTNQLEGRVQATCATLGDYDGTTFLREAPDLGGGMSTIDPAFAENSGATYATETKIDILSIHTVLGTLAPGRVRLMKLDCEGSELTILAALTSTERERIDSVAVEYHVQAYPLRELMEQLLSWKDFHLSKVASPGISNAVLHLARRNAMQSWSAQTA